jgi:hypothetical protein
LSMRGNDKVLGSLQARRVTMTKSRTSHKLIVDGQGRGCFDRRIRPPLP